MFPAALLFVAGVGVLVVFGGVRLLDLAQAVFLYSHSAVDISTALPVIGSDLLAVLLSGLALALPGAFGLVAGAFALRASCKKSASITG